jgi:hypothetical protein
MILIESQTLGSAVTEVTFSGLAGDTDYCYLLLWRVENTTGSGTNLSLQPNAVSSNQVSDAMSWDGTGDGHGTTATLRFAHVETTRVGMGRVLFMAATGLRRGGGSAQKRQSSVAANVQAMDMAMLWNETATAITSLVVSASEAGSINTGSSFHLYRFEMS